MNFFLQCFFLLTTLTLTAQPTIEWEKNYGGRSYERAGAITSTSDGGFIMVGTSPSSDGDVGDNNGVADIWVVKLSVTGDIQWQQLYCALGGSRHFELQE